MVSEPCGASSGAPGFGRSRGSSHSYEHSRGIYIRRCNSMQRILQEQLSNPGKLKKYVSSFRKKISKIAYLPTQVFEIYVKGLNFTAS